jgi:pyridoxine kinase
MPIVLSIQSWVACGNVGNCAALFPLQRLGIDTWSLNTVAFSNHTGYGKWRGEAVPTGTVASLFEGIAELSLLPRCDAVLSGYLGEPEIGPLLLDIVARVKTANPRALYCCDPVMGDVGPGWYVRAGIPEWYRERALSVADIATPNRFELEWLSGSRIASLGEAAAAASAVRRFGPEIVLVTSLEPAPDRLSVLAAAADGVWAVETPRLAIEATGCGDALAALFLGWLLKGRPVPEALGLTVSAVWGVVAATLAAGSGELALVAAQDQLVAPARRFHPQKL